jgi:hypothetical protein
MGREKVSARGKEIRSESSEEEEERSSKEEEHSSREEYGIHVHDKRTKPQAPPSRAQGRGHGHDGNPILNNRTTTVGARTKRASTTDEVGGQYDEDMDLSLYAQMDFPIHPPECTRRDPPLVNFMKDETDMWSLRFCPEDPRRLQRSFFSDDHFWLAHHANWYESTILPKGRITTEMKWVDWPFLLDLPAPIEKVIQAVHTRCQYMGITYLMGLRSDYSQEVVAQFYATLYVDRDENEMHFTLGGKRFKISVSEFASLFKLRGATTTNQFSSELFRLHSEDELEVTKMRFMYDRTYGNINYGHTSGLTPYYKMLNLLFRYTLCPRGGDSDNISHRAINLLYQMAPDQPKFNACHFLWNEIIICSHTSSSGCHYAPYIFMMVKHATKLDLKTDVFMSHTILAKGNLLNLSVLASTRPVLMLEDHIQASILLMDLLMRVPPPLKLHQQRVHMIPFQWRVPLTLMGLQGVREGSSTFLQRACLPYSTCSAKILESVRPIVNGWLKSFIGKRRFKRTWQVDLIFHTLRSMR